MTKKPTANELKDKMSGLAERIALGFGTRLDYSIESVKEVERVLKAIHNDYKLTGSEDGVQGIALEFGAYIVKVIERHFGPVDWQRDDPTFGEDTFPLHWSNSTIYPYSWCLKRILDGPGDDVWFKFQAIVLNHDKKKGVSDAPL
jgi:hypothetical protein